MTFYKTSKEKAAEWNISIRHIQYLCKEGKIEGAIKKAGIWFIPDDAPIPIQYTKTGDNHFHYVGTKKKIFDCSIELIKSKGFEAVSMKEIADIVGITQSSMYNHFKSKQEILDTIYNFYGHYYLKNRPSLEAIEPILRNGSLFDIIKSVTYKFNDDHLKQMTDIIAILLYRCAIDERARELTKSLMVDEGVKFAETVFNKAVEIGRLSPMDTHSAAVFINSIKLYMFHIWVVDSSPETTLKVREDEARLYQHASRLLTDLKPSDKSVETPDKNK